MSSMAAASAASNSAAASLPSIVVVSDVDGRKFKMVLRGALEKLSVSKIKHYLEQSTRIPASDQIIHFNGAILDDQQVGSDFGLYADAVLHLNSAALVGGGGGGARGSSSPLPPPQSSSSSSAPASWQQPQPQPARRPPPAAPDVVATSSNKIGDEVAALRSSLDQDAYDHQVAQRRYSGGGRSGSSAEPGGVIPAPVIEGLGGKSSHDFQPIAAASIPTRSTVHSYVQENVTATIPPSQQRQQRAPAYADSSRGSSQQQQQQQQPYNQHSNVMAAPGAPMHSHLPPPSSLPTKYDTSHITGSPSTALADQQVNTSLVMAENAQLKKVIDKLRGQVSALEAAAAATDPRYPGGFPPGGVIAAARVQLAGLSQELGTALDFDDNFTCVIGSDDSTILVTVDPQTERLFIYSTLLASLPSDERRCASIYRALLEWSMLGRDMAGGGVGIDAQSGVVIMSTSIDLKNARPPALRDTAPVFVESLVRWRQTLSAMVTA